MSTARPAGAVRRTCWSTARTSTRPWGTSILGRRPRPEERPRWDRLLQFARDRWGQEAVGLFFLAANSELPMSFVQALIAMGYRPVPLAGDRGEKVVDIAIQRTLAALTDRRGDVLLVSNDGDFVEGIESRSPAAAGSGWSASPSSATRGSPRWCSAASR